MERPFLSIVIPCYNEEANLKRGVLTEVRDFLKGRKYTWEVIVSDDGSTDGSKELAAKQIKNWKYFKLSKNPHAGKPSALWSGIQAAEGKYVLFTDMDQSTPISQVDKLLPYASKGFKAVIGSRGLSRKKFPFYRRLGSVVFMSFRKSIVLSEIDDTQCGFKLFDTKVAKEAFPMLEFFRKENKATGWTVTSYDVELLHIIKKLGHKIKEVRVSWEERDESISKGGGIIRYIRESKEMLVQILRVKINDLRGFYDK